MVSVPMFNTAEHDNWHILVLKVLKVLLTSRILFCSVCKIWDSQKFKIKRNSYLID